MKRSSSPDKHVTAAAKKAKHEGSSLSNLLKKVDNTNSVVVSSTLSAAESARAKNQELDSKLETQSTNTLKSGKAKEDVGEGLAKKGAGEHTVNMPGSNLFINMATVSNVLRLITSQKHTPRKMKGIFTGQIVAVRFWLYQTREQLARPRRQSQSAHRVGPNTRRKIFSTKRSCYCSPGMYPRFPIAFLCQ